MTGRHGPHAARCAALAQSAPLVPDRSGHLLEHTPIDTRSLTDAELCLLLLRHALLPAHTGDRAQLLAELIETL